MLHANQRVRAFEAWRSTPGVERPNAYEAYCEGSRETLRLVVEYLERNSDSAEARGGGSYWAGRAESLDQAAKYLRSGLTSETNETKVEE